MDTFLYESFVILSIDHISNSKEERVGELLCLASLIYNITKDLIHRNYRDSQVNSKALGKFFLEYVRWAEENNFGICGPSLNETAILVKEALLEA